jgi:hypothetical protein
LLDYTTVTEVVGVFVRFRARFKVVTITFDARTGIQSRTKLCCIQRLEELRCHLPRCYGTFLILFNISHNIDHQRILSSYIDLFLSLDPQSLLSILPGITALHGYQFYWWSFVWPCGRRKVIGFGYDTESQLSHLCP